MAENQFHQRRVAQVENAQVRVTATIEGGHVAEILHKATGVNPLWLPPWPSIEPSAYRLENHPEYGTGSEAQLLAGILGHNLCLDTFGAPSPEEAAAGISVHGEGSVIPYEIATTAGGALTLSGILPLAQIRFTRRLQLEGDSNVVKISESVENLTSSDRPIAWTQHVTLGPPFLAAGKTQFRMPATRSQVADATFNDNLGPYAPDAVFEWPMCPLKNGGREDLRVYTKGLVSGGFTAHLLDTSKEQAFFLAWSPVSKVLFGYVWQRKDFPWMARWEEFHLRTDPPWNSNGVTCGMEFGVSPFVGSRREMVERGSLFGVPGYRWLPALGKLNVDYCAFVTAADTIPESVSWDGKFQVKFA